MGYKVTARLKIDLSEFGEDNSGNPFFAELQHPKLLTHQQQLDLAKTAPVQKSKKKGANGEEEEPELTKEERNKSYDDSLEMTDYVQSFLRAWNLIDINTEEPVDVKDTNAFKRIPGEVVTKIVVEFTKTMNQRSEETKNS